MITAVLKGMLFVIVMAFYSLCVWRVVNDYFRNEFKSYIDQDPLLATASGRQRVISQPVHPSLQQVLQSGNALNAQQQQPHRPPQIHEILGQGVDHRDAAKFREHVASLSRQLHAKHQPVVVQVDRDELLQRLSPDLGEQIQKAVDASFAEDSQAGAPAAAVEPHKYAVVVFDDELPETDATSNEVNGPQLAYDDGDDGDDYDGTLGTDDDMDEGDAFIAVPSAANAHHRPPVISGGSDGRTDNGANQMLVTNDLGDGSLDDVRRRPSATGEAAADSDSADGSSGDNELIMAIDGNLIKSTVPLVAHRDVAAPQRRRADVLDEVLEAVAAARRAGDSDADSGALTEDCLCVPEEVAEEEEVGVRVGPVH